MKCSGCAENCIFGTQKFFGQKRREHKWNEKLNIHKKEVEQEQQKKGILTEKGFKAYDHLAVDFALSVGASEKEK